MLTVWERRLAETMWSDRHRLRRKLRELREAEKTKRPCESLLTKLDEEFRRSISRRETRAASVPKIQFDSDLPILAKRGEIEAAIREHQVVIVCGETGSGKSTQLPKLCLSLGRGVSGLIGHTQPRRVAARTIAARVAEELKTTLGTTVGFKVRFTDATQPNTLIKLMTDGVLLAETRSDRFLDQYDTIIVDEAHERSLNIDFLLGYLKRLLPKRPDLKVIITSATIDATRFAEHFGTSVAPAPILEVSGRMYPVEVRWQTGRLGLCPDPDGRDGIPTYDDPHRAILDAVDELAAENLWDMLIFQPTEWDIHETAKLLRGHCARRGWTNEVEILPLYARLTLPEQQKVFDPRGGKKRIVIATNVAESSLTVPRILSVIDTGTARISRYSSRSKMQRLPIEAISQASANQRAGRCGRIAPGVCLRLYDENDFATREKFTPPEIVRTNLASVILQTESLNLGRLEEFPFLEPPKPTAIRDGYKTLFELGAVNERDQLTELGHKLAKLPVDPRIARIIVAGHAEGCLNDILIIAAALEAQDPRDRPLDKQQAADEKHKQFQHEDSDFLGFLKLWDFFHHLKETLSKSQVRKACVQNFLNFNRLREWADLHRQLEELVEESGMKVGKRQWSVVSGPLELATTSKPNGRRTTDDGPAAAIHRALLTGFLANIAAKDGETNEYSTAGGLKASIWPGSGVFAKKPKWLVAAEVVETSKRFLRVVARIDPAWIEPLAEHLLTRTHSEPHWDRAAGSAMAFEKVSLFGLMIVPRRRVRFGRINPAISRELLIRQGLVEGELDCNAEFFVHNQLLREELEELRVKSRRADFLKGEDALIEFYEQRLPADVVDLASLLKWCKARSSGFSRSEPPEGGTTNNLFLTRDDLLNPQAEVATAEQFPSELKLQHLRVPLEYKLNPGEADDGITIVVPQEGLNQLDAQRLGWLVPGLLEEKIVALIKSLPKEVRRLFVPVPDTAKQVLKQIKFGEGDLNSSLAAILSRLAGQRIDANEFREDDLPSHLRINVKVVGAQGKSLAASRDLQQLRTRLGAKASASFSAIDHSQWNRDGLTDWDFDVLPPSVDLQHGGLKLKGFPTLVDQGDRVSLRLADSAESASLQTHAGLRRLFVIAASKELKKQVQHIPDLGRWQLLIATLPDNGKLPQQLAELIAERACRMGTLARPSSTEIAEMSKSAHPPPRTKTQFQELVRTAKLQIPAAVQDVIKLVSPLLAAYTDARRAVEGCRLPFAQTAVADCREQLARLTEAGFLTATPWDWLQQFPRYFKGIAVRLQKLAAGGQTRDQRAMVDLEPRWRKLLERLDALRKTGRVDPGLMTCRWMLEELRVSLFVQELRTAIPISPQRWDKQWEQVVAGTK